MHTALNFMCEVPIYASGVEPACDLFRCCDACMDHDMIVLDWT